MYVDDKKGHTSPKSTSIGHSCNKPAKSARVLDFKASSEKLRDKQAARAILKRSSSLSW